VSRADSYLVGVKENLLGHKRKLRFVLEALEHWATVHGQCPRVLDVGCGTGAVLTHHIARAGYEVLGVDTDAHSIAVAQATFVVDGLRFRCASLEDVPGVYGAVIVSEVLEHVEDPRSFLVRVREMLEPNGLLIVTVPNGFGPFELENALWKAARMDRIWTRGIAPRLKRLLQRSPTPADASGGLSTNSLDTAPHINFFTMRSMRRLLRSAGFEVQGTGKSSLISGPFSETILPKHDWLYRLNAAAGGLAPSWAVNGHYFLAVRKF
jgi:SAM-dependent methyltransferase